MKSLHLNLRTTIGIILFAVGVAGPIVLFEATQPGHGIAASLRSAEIELPILLMTAFGDRELHQEARRHGVLSVLNKPFEVSTLRTAVRAALFGS